MGFGAWGTNHGAPSPPVATCSAGSERSKWTPLFPVPIPGRDWETEAYSLLPQVTVDFLHDVMATVKTKKHQCLPQVHDPRVILVGQTKEVMAQNSVFNVPRSVLQAEDLGCVTL